MLAGKVNDGAGLGNVGSRLLEWAPLGAQSFASWTAIFVSLGIPREILTLKRPILALGLVPQTGT